MHLDITGSHGQHIFDLQRGKNHSRLFLPEALVLHADGYAKNKQEENTFEAREAKKWTLTVDEYREQKHIMKKAEDEKQKELKNKHEQLKNHSEEHGVAGIGSMDDQPENDPIPELIPDQSVSQAFSKERVEREKKELEKIKESNEMKRQNSQSYEVIEKNFSLTATCKSMLLLSTG